MRKKKVYLDTSVFIAEFDKKSIQHKILTSFLKQIKNIKDTEFCYSKWALTEVYNKLTKRRIDELKIVKYIKDILDKNKIRFLRLKPMQVSPNKDYNFDDFFNDLARDLIKYKTGKERPGLGDIIHIRIIRNNKINIILTFDSDFENILGFTVLNLGKVEKDILKEFDKQNGKNVANTNNTK